MTEAPHEVEAERSVIFRQRRHALLVLRPLSSSRLADPPLAEQPLAEQPLADPALESPALDGDCEAAGAVGAARLAFADGPLSPDRVFAALLGGGPLSALAPFVYLVREGNGLRVIARGPLRVVELPNAPHVGIRPAVITSGEALTWVEAVLPAARGVEVTVEDVCHGLDEVPLQLLFAEADEEVAETIAPTSDAAEVTADPDLDGAVGPGEGPLVEGMFAQATIAEATIVELPSEDADDDEGAEPPIPQRGAQTAPVPIVDADAETDAHLVGEHDGHTVLSDEASRIRQAAFARRATQQDSADQAQPDASQPAPSLHDLAPQEQALQLGDHDGHTVVGGSVRELRRGPAGQVPDRPVPDQQVPAEQSAFGELGDTVLAQALSFETHPEGRSGVLAPPVAPVAPPTASVPPAAPAAPAAPARSAPRAGYVVELSTGGSVELTGPLVLGRAPSMGSEQTGGTPPRHVKLSGATDISRNHVLMSVEGGVIVVTDLHSRNGTDVIMPGRGPQRLRAGEPTAVMPGTVVDLGSGVFLTVRNLSMTASE
ncbi:FHA domain-containing protein [Pseudoclavibacter helvolus]|uniref:FHA domain-containing protein n=1 Tax=Pseudoclavibacter helvolus TaxID=255205 RepID=UPI003C712103